MLKKMYLSLLLIALYTNLYSQENWKLIKNSKGIEVYTSKQTSDFKTFRGRTVLNESIHSFYAVINDIEALPSWGYKIIQTSIFEQSGDTIQIYHAIAEAPFPYKNRDGVYLNKATWNKASTTLMVSIEMLDDYLKPSKKHVRVTGKGFWRAEVLPSGKLDITFQMQVNPGGAIPAWLANLFIAETPFHSLLNIQKVIKLEKYQSKTFNFIH